MIYNGKSNGTPESSVFWAYFSEDEIPQTFFNRDIVLSLNRVGSPPEGSSPKACKVTAAFGGL